MSICRLLCSSSSRACFLAQPTTCFSLDNRGTTDGRQVLCNFRRTPFSPFLFVRLLSVCPPPFVIPTLPIVIVGCERVWCITTNNTMPKCFSGTSNALLRTTTNIPHPRPVRPRVVPTASTQTFSLEPNPACWGVVCADADWSRPSHQLQLRLPQTKRPAK